MPSSKLAEMERNQEKDFQSIKRNKRNIERNYQDIDGLLERVKRLEAVVEKYESSKPEPKTKSKPGPKPGKAKTKTNTTNTLSVMKAKLLELQKRSAQLKLERSALIKFNKMNEGLPIGEKHTWQRILESTDGNPPRIKTFDSIVDNKSLDCLLSNPATKAIVDKMLVAEGGPELNISTKIRNRYWVFIKDDKLVTLSTDFLGGVGSEYLWTEDALLQAPSDRWKAPVKRENDPRRRHVNPLTNAMWVPEDERKRESSSDDGSVDEGGDGSGKDDDGGRDGSGKDDDGGRDGSGKDDDGGRDSSGKDDDKDDDDDDDSDDNDDAVADGGAENDEKPVEKGGGDNVSDLGDVCVESGAEVGAVESLSGNKRLVEEYAGTSSDSDSDDEEENVGRKMPRVM